MTKLPWDSLHDLFLDLDQRGIEWPPQFMWQEALERVRELRPTMEEVFAKSARENEE
ncbi:MAG TPA: hypothetical protein VL899_16455 [Alphaproteobacteria bacterium]|nr:hypothetical protein [Alphaproteobacteria bacterium]